MIAAHRLHNRKQKDKPLKKPKQRRSTMNDTEEIRTFWAPVVAFPRVQLIRRSDRTAKKRLSSPFTWPRHTTRNFSSSLGAPRLHHTRNFLPLHYLLNFSNWKRSSTLPPCRPFKFRTAFASAREFAVRNAFVRFFLWDR